ncbi:SecY-interacting protein Syd [Clostridium sp. DJ247]|uniref:SecY-interacting protein Syd n=1 Tax=Clostridium sp. DJ247 TaxID=2726188 RepID=UPI00162729E3|nr:SecY-interacting protein Syd [Clostridium sp. DJ247]MBC2582754.1 SecY-interacting protein Syd [Clostridium sp. DJ247]
MSVKIAMEKFFDNMMEGYSKTEEGYPMSSYVDYIDKMIYIGEQDKEGWIRWKPIKKDKVHDLKDIEEELGIKIHNNIKEYFNSYWFIRIRASYNSYKISLDGVQPSDKRYNEFKWKLRGYKNNHEGKLNYIPLGLVNNMDSLVLENETGKIKVENYEAETYKTIANSLEELILGLKPAII